MRTQIKVGEIKGGNKMLCYKDKTFCSNWEKCKNSDTCHRAFTKEVEKECNEWWKRFNSTDGAPVAMSDFKECFVEK